MFRSAKRKNYGGNYKSGGSNRFRVEPPSGKQSADLPSQIKMEQNEESKNEVSIEEQGATKQLTTKRLYAPHKLPTDETLDALLNSCIESDPESECYTCPSDTDSEFLSINKTFINMKKNATKDRLKIQLEHQQKLFKQQCDLIEEANRFLDKKRKEAEKSQTEIKKLLETFTDLDDPRSSYTIKESREFSEREMQIKDKKKVMKKSEPISTIPPKTKFNKTLTQTSLQRTTNKIRSYENEASQKTLKNEIKHVDLFDTNTPILTPVKIEQLLELDIQFTNINPNEMPFSNSPEIIDTIELNPVSITSNGRDSNDRNVVYENSGLKDIATSSGEEFTENIQNYNDLDMDAFSSDEDLDVELVQTNVGNFILQHSEPKESINFELKYKSMKLNEECGRKSDAPAVEIFTITQEESVVRSNIKIIDFDNEKSSTQNRQGITNKPKRYMKINQQSETPVKLKGEFVEILNVKNVQRFEQLDQTIVGENYNKMNDYDDPTEETSKRYSRKDIKALINIDISRSKYICSFCKRVFAKQAIAELHIARTHLKIKDKICGICNRGFCASGDLTRHIRSHTGYKPFKCSVEGCERAFIGSGDLHKHVRAHNKNVNDPHRYVCDLCPKGFDRLYDYNRHYLTHQDKDKISPNLLSTCRYCKKTFFRKDQYKSHLLIHFEVYPYHCDLCNTDHRSSSNFSRHIREHEVSGEYNRFPILYKCEFCKISFQAKSEIKKHFRMCIYQKSSK